jgi:hypothetical protein
MSFVDKLAAGAERAAKEAEKVFDKGQAKAGEMRIRMKMDGVAKKLGYLVLDSHQGREVDESARQALIGSLVGLEAQLVEARAAAAAKAQAKAEAAGTYEAGGSMPPSDG